MNAPRVAPAVAALDVAGRHFPWGAQLVEHRVGVASPATDLVTPPCGGGHGVIESALGGL